MVLNEANQLLQLELNQISRSGDQAMQEIWKLAKTLPKKQETALLAAASLVCVCIEKAEVLEQRVQQGTIQVVSAVSKDGANGRTD